MSRPQDMLLVANGMEGCAILLVKLTVLLGGVFAIQYLAQRSSASFRHAILTAGLTLAPVLVGLHFLSPSWSVPYPSIFASRSIGQSDHARDPSAPERSLSQMSDSFPIDLSVGNPFEAEFGAEADSLGRGVGAFTVESELTDSGESLNASILGMFVPFLLPVAMAGWLLGGILFLSRIVFAWASVSRLIAKARPLVLEMDSVSRSPSVRQMLLAISGAGIHIKISPSEIQAPLGMGLFRRTILLPASCVGWTPSQWRSVALHEHAHFMRHDCLVNLFARLHQALFWFHPFSWLLVSQLHDECEKACDDYVIRSGVSRLDYADALFHVARTTGADQISLIATMTMCDGTPLESRIASILSPKTVRHPVRLISFLSIFVAIAAIAIPVSTAQLSGGAAESEFSTVAASSVRGSARLPMAGLPISVLPAGRISDRIANNSMAYHLRPPKNYDPARKVPAIVILHGASSNSKSYIEHIVDTWPEIADEYLLIGIDGEVVTPNGSKANPRHHYSFVNFAGKSNYTGFPGTDRESPALVAEVLEEIRSDVSISTLFLGGHGQGGWLTYSVYMNYAELIDGAFPMGAAVIIQCEPDAYSDEQVRTLQRDTPIAIIHSKNDLRLDHSFSQRAYQGFLDDSFPMVRLFDDDLNGHAFARQDLPGAIAWLKSMSVRDPDGVVETTLQLVQQGRFRDAAGLLFRLSEESLTRDQRLGLRAVTRRIRTESERAASQFEHLIETDEDGKWIDDFLEFRRQFEFSPAALGAMKKFDELRSKHDLLTDDHFAEARELIDAGNPEKANELYREIIDQFYASSLYLDAKQILNSRRLPN